MKNAGICIAGRKGFFFCASGGVKGCSSGLASARDPDRFWAGLRRWGGHRE